MSFKTPTNTTTTIQALAPGTYPARIVRIVDMGMQAQEYQGETRDPAHELMITYELLDEFLKDDDGNDIEDKPRWMSEFFPLRSLASGKAKSTKRYTALDPLNVHKGDFSQFLGAPVMVTLNAVEREKDGNKVTYNNVTNVSPMRPKEAAKAPELVNPSGLFDLEAPDLEMFAKLSEYHQKKITSNLNYSGSKLEAMLEGKSLDEVLEESDVPF